MAYKGYSEIIQHKSSIEESELRSNMKSLRTYYNTISLYVLRHLYDTWVIKQYDQFIKNQSQSISDPLAPNGLHYELRDIESLKSKGIIDKDKQISILSTWDKYTETNPWIDNEPLVNVVNGKQVNTSFDDTDYTLHMIERVTEYKKIKTLYYDKMTFGIYDGSSKVATTSYYIYSPSKYTLRYVTLYVDGLSVIDTDHIIEYNIDNV